MRSGSVSTAALLVGARISVALSSVASIAIVTPVLGADGMGVLSLVLSMANLFGMLVGAISMYFYRQVVEWQQQDQLLKNLRRYIRFLVAAGIVVVVVTPLLYLLPSHPWAAIPAAWMVGLVAGHVLLVSLVGALLHLLNTLGHRLAFGALSNLASWGGVSLAWVGVSLVQASAFWWLLGLLLAQLLTLMLAGWVLQPSLTGTPAVTKVQRAVSDFALGAIVRFSWPLLLCNVLYWVQRSTFAPWMAGIAGTQVLGLFSVAFSLGMQAMLSFDTLFRELYGPIYWRAIAHAKPEAQTRSWESYAATFFPLLCAWLVLVCASGDTVLGILTAPQFHGLGAMVAWGALSQFWISISSTYQVLASSKMDNRSLLVSNLLGAAVSVVMLTFVPVTDPMLLAAIAINAGLAVTAAANGWQLRRQFPHRLPVSAMLTTCALMAPVGLLVFAPRSLQGAGPPSLSLLVAMLIYTLWILHRNARAWLKGLT